MTKRKPKDKRIGDIILAAVDEFLESGYEGASMEAIARRADISKGGLYHHFTSKDEILLHANKKLNEPVYEMMQEAVKKPSASEGLVWYIKNYLEYWREHKKELVFYMLSMTKMMDSPTYMQMYEKYTEGYINFLRNLYEKGITSGEFIPHSAYESAVILMAALDGIVGYLVVDKELKLESVVSIFLDKFIYSLQIKSNIQQNPEG